MTARSTYVASVVSAENQRDFAGVAGNAATAPNFGNNTQQYPSIASTLGLGIPEALVSTADEAIE